MKPSRRLRQQFLFGNVGWGPSAKLHGVSSHKTIMLTPLAERWLHHLQLTWLRQILYVRRNEFVHARNNTTYSSRCVSAAFLFQLMLNKTADLVDNIFTSSATVLS